MGTFEMHWRAVLTWCPGRLWNSLQCRCQGCQVCTQDEVRGDQGMQYISASSQQRHGPLLKLSTSFTLSLQRPYAATGKAPMMEF